MDLQKRNIRHRDLKPANLLIDSDLNVQVIDFGSSSVDGKSLIVEGRKVTTR
jgi:serine/threonine protein kinase